MRVEIENDSYDDHLTHMEYILKHAINDATKWNTVKKGWHVDIDKHGWRVCSRAKTTSEKAYVCMGRHYTSLDSIREAFYADNTIDYLAMTAILYGDELLSASVLDMHMRATKDDPSRFFGVKALKLKSKIADPLKPSLDYIFLEYSGTCMDAQGRMTFYVISEPISHRASDKLSSVRLYRARSDGSVDVFVRAHIHPELYVLSPNLITWKDLGILIPACLSKDFLPLTKEVSLYESLVLTTGPFAALWDYGKKRCNVCFKGCGLLRRHHHCRTCGFIMCSGCTMKLYCVNRPTKKKTNKNVLEEKFCTRCWVDAKSIARKPNSVTATSNAFSVNRSTCNTLLNPIQDDIILLDAPDKAATAEWWETTRDGDLHLTMSAASFVSTSTSVDAVQDTPLSNVSSYHRRAGRLNSFNLLTTPSSKEEIAARMDEMNESIAHQTFLLSTMANILTPRSPKSSSMTVEEEIATV